MSVVFSRASGVSCVSRSFCSCLLGVGGGLRGVPGFGGWRARVSCFLFVGGAGLGCVCARPVPELSGSGCGRGRWPGSGCACCPVPVVGVGLRPVSSAACCGGGFRVLFFSVRCFSCSPGFRCWSSWSCRGSGGCGGCRVGLGLFFLRLLLYWPGLVSGFLLWGAGLGLGWVLFGEFDPGSGRTLAACLTHASRTGPPLWGWVEWRTGEYHVSNLPPAPG